MQSNMSSDYELSAFAESQTKNLKSKEKSVLKVKLFTS